MYTDSVAHITDNRKSRLLLSDGSEWLLTGNRRNIIMSDELAHVMGIVKCAPIAISSSDNVDVVKNGNVTNGAEKLKTFLHVLLPIYKHSIDKGGLPVHSGLAELNGSGVLLVAPSGTGKSTCCRRLPDHWLPLCDDQALVVLDQKNNYRVHPFPTLSDYLLKQTGITWNVQHSVPLAGIFFLEQALIDRVDPEPFGQGKAAVMLYASAKHICRKFSSILGYEEQKKMRQDFFYNACSLVKKIPAYRLRVSLHGKFWTEIERVLDLEANIIP